MQSVSVMVDDVRKKLFQEPRLELAAKGAFRLGRYITSSGRAFQVLTWKARLPKVDRLTDGTRRRLVYVERSDRLSGRLRTGTNGPRYGGALP